MLLKPVTTEKAVKLIDIDNTLTFEVERQSKKNEIKLEVEKTFEIKVEKIRTLIRSNKKIAYIKFRKENPAIDLATKLGMI